jgi:hypothetical protein
MTKMTEYMHRMLILPILVLVYVALQITIWSFDRHPPFEILSSDLAAATPGRALFISATVRRDIARKCSASYSRTIIDSNSFRYDIPGTQSASSRLIKQLDSMHTGRMSVSIVLPDEISPGPATLVTSLEYVCNPIHRVFPIEVLTIIPFRVDAPVGTQIEAERTK